MRLQGKIALVTGGARGIGLAVAKALAAEGAVPVIADINEGGARDALSTLGHAERLALGVDVADEASVAAMVEAIVARYGRLDILVNNAGIGGNTPFLDIKPRGMEPHDRHQPHGRLPGRAGGGARHGEGKAAARSSTSPRCPASAAATAAPPTAPPRPASSS